VVNRLAFNRKLESGTIALRLYPQELGELKIEIQIERDVVKAQVIAQNPHVQELLERNIPKLREALSQQNLDLQMMSVTIAENDKNGTNQFQEEMARHNLQQTVKSRIKGEFNIPDEETVDEGSGNDDPRLSVHA
jgi:flagellar hook-length control protein FliK